MNSWATCFLAGVLWAVMDVHSSHPHFSWFGSTCMNVLWVHYFHDPWVPQLAQGSWGFLKPGKLPGNIDRKWLGCFDSAAASLCPCTVVVQNAVPVPVSYYLNSALHFGNTERQSGKKRALSTTWAPQRQLLGHTWYMSIKWLLTYLYIPHTPF